MAHDLLTPLGQIITAHDCLVDLLGLENDDVSTLLRMIGSSSKILESIIQQVTELSRIKMNQFKPQFNDFDLR